MNLSSPGFPIKIWLASQTEENDKVSDCKIYENGYNKYRKMNRCKGEKNMSKKTNRIDDIRWIWVK